MAVIKKTLFPKNLDKFAVLVNDTQSDSKYFKITELPDTFTGGKNAFLIAGSEYLVPDTRIQIELKDSAGNIIYHEPGEGLISSSINGESFVTEYYEGVSKVVAVYIYPDTAYGPCTLTILGELSEYEDGNGILTPVPFDWENKYNVKWQRQINVNPSLANTTKIRFYQRPTVTISELLEPIYRIESGSKVNSGVSQSFADIKISQLETFAGDVKRIKVFRTSLGDISDYDLIQDILIESKELLTTFGLSGSVVGNTGIFSNEVLEKYWNTGSLNVGLSNDRIESGAKLSGSGLFTYTSSLDLKALNTYELNLDAFYSSSNSSNLGVYLSYQENPSSSFTTTIGILSGSVPTKNLLDTIIPFKIDRDYPSASLYLSQSNGEWHVGNVSLRLSQDTAFSPNEVSFITTMPSVIGNETFNFKFEFYDVNNNYVPVAVTQSATFTGGVNINTTLLIVSASSSSSLAQLYAVSSSISGTMTVYSSSASSSISSLSSSVSSSNSFILSSSLSKVQQLADGEYSGSFIGDTVIYSPTIGGQQGYISSLFKVGTTPSIYLDARQNPRKIFIGGAIPSGQTEYSGAYNNSNTNIYLDSTGKFSLGNQLSFDGNNLTVNGTINVTGGNAATDANALLYAGRAATSASVSSSAAYTNAVAAAAADATTKSNAAYNNAISVASSDATTKSNAAFDNAAAQVKLLADGGYTGTFISNKEIFSPVVGGTVGYFSNQFRVGNAGIVLDGVNKRIYIGSGTYANSNTGFYVDNSSNFSLGDKLTFSGNTLTVNGTINANAGNFSGNITSTATISGGSIYGGSIVGSTLSGATGTFSGTITASGGTIGSWTIGNGNLVSTNSRMIINASAPSIVLLDGSGGAKTTIRTGALSTISSATIGIGSFNIISPTITYTGTEVTSGKIYTEAQVSLGNQTAGLYNSAYSYNYTSLGTLVQVDGSTTGVSSYGQGVDILNSSGTVIAEFGLGGGTVTNVVFVGSPVTNTGGAGTGFISLTLPTDGEYFVRPWQSYRYGVSAGTGYARIYPKTLATPTLSFTKVTGFAELTDEGMQIVSSTNRYIKMRTGGLTDLDAAGSWYHDAGDVQFVQNTGYLYARGSLVQTAAGNFSDVRLKEDITDYTHGLSHIKQFNPKWFRFKKRYNEKLLSGLIAQEVEEISAEYVNEDSEGFKELNYPAIYMTMLNSIKELSIKIEQLETQISGSK